MAYVNADKPHLWKADIVQSIDLYNSWFIQFAPQVYRDTRVETTRFVQDTLSKTDNLTNISPELLRQHPEILPMLRMATAPPIARDRLIGLAEVSSNIVINMELYRRLPPRAVATVDQDLAKIGRLILLLADRDIFPWLDSGVAPTEIEVYRASTIVADRLCGAISDPIVRNAQEQRQLARIKQWLEARGYTQLKGVKGLTLTTMPPGSFSFRLNVPVMLDAAKKVNIPVDVVIMPKDAQYGTFPVLIEAKSAGDYTNTNKRRKEEAVKLAQLKKTYGDDVRFVLFLCGYFDSGYLGYEAAEGIDWVWEHRIDDLAGFGV
jgi:hypothetical protein